MSVNKLDALSETELKLRGVRLWIGLIACAMSTVWFAVIMFLFLDLMPGFALLQFVMAVGFGIGAWQCAKRLKDNNARLARL